MARGGGGSQLWDIVGVAIIGLVAYYAFQSGALNDIIKNITQGLGGLSVPSIGGAGIGGTAAGGGAATGDCSGGPYKSTGKTVKTTQRGPTERHYASGKADTTTIEKNAKGFNLQNYQFVNYITLKKVDEDDNVSLKLGGTHMGSGWFDNGVGFKDGQTCLGTEKNHPSTNACVKKGPKIGSILNKKVGIASTYFKSSNKTELWTDTGPGWKKMVEGSDVDGFNPNSSKQEAQLRIDAAPGVDIHCSVVQEIAGSASAGMAHAFATSAAYRSYRAYEDYKRIRRRSANRFRTPPMYYRGYAVQNVFPSVGSKLPSDCGDLF